MRQLLRRGAQGHFHAQTLPGLFAEEGQDRVIKQPPPPSALLFSEKKETASAKISFLWKLWLGRAPWACETKWAGRQPLSCMAGSRRPTEARHQAELDDALHWAGRQHRPQWVHSCWFFPSPSPALPPPARPQADPALRTPACPRETHQSWPHSLLQPLPLSEHSQQTGRERKALRKQLNLVICSYFWVCCDTFVNSAFPLRSFGVLQL